jgi:RHS repeat-associated protein
MGPLPAAGGWVKLEIPASAVGLEGKIVNGMAFTLYGGRAAWDKTGKISTIPPIVLGPPINNKVYTVDPATNRLTSVNGAPMSLSYDAAGNHTNDGNGERIYDGENRLVEARNSGGVVVSRYVYDAEGRRVRRIIGGQETWQVYGIAGELLSEYAAGAASNSPQKEYGYRNGQLLVVWDGSEVGDRQLQWLVQDHLGSTRMVVDRSGSLGGIRRRDFAPFGEELSAGVGIRNAGIGYIIDSVRQKFDGYERDPETEWDFAQARYHSSIQGRFTSVDQGPFIPADPQSWNRYSFVQNNPLKFIDPTGETLILEGSYAEYILGELEELTGYKLKRDPSTGKVTIDENSPRNMKGTSKELAALLKDIVDPKRSDVKIKTVSDEEGVTIDKFATRQLDVADYKVAKRDAPTLGAAILGHVLAEYSMAEWVQGPPTSNSWLFDTSHQSGLEFDRKVVSDFTGKAEQKRTESIIQEDSNSMTVRIKYTSVTYDMTIRTLNSSSLSKTKVTNVVEHKVK